MSIFRKPVVPVRETFDASNPAHVESLGEFLKTGNWGSTQFFAEQPFSEVPMTVLIKFCEATLGVKRETLEERRARLDVVVEAND